MVCACEDLGILHVDADASEAVDLQGQDHLQAIPAHGGLDCLPGFRGEYPASVLQEADLDRIDCGDAVALEQSASGIHPVRSHGIDAERNCEVEHQGSVENRPQHRTVDIESDGVGPAEDPCLTHFPASKLRLQHPEIFRNIVVEGENLVSGAEPHLLRKLVGIDLRSLVGDVAPPPDSHDQAEGDDGEDEVVEHPSGHHQQALPGIVRAEFPALRLALHLVQVHALVYHARDLAVAAERKPSYAVFGLPLESGRADAGEPLAALGAEEKGAARVEE